MVLKEIPLFHAKKQNSGDLSSIETLLLLLLLSLLSRFKSHAASAPADLTQVLNGRRVNKRVEA